jgi:HK97 family phage portal protein
MATVIQRVIDTVLGRNIPATPPISLRQGIVPVPVWQVGKPQWGDPSVSTYIGKLYGLNATIYACVMARALALSVAPLRVYIEENGQKTEFFGRDGEQHPLRDLITHPSPDMSEAEFWSLVSVIADVTNICVIEKVRARPLFAGDPGRVVELRPLRTDWLRAIPRDYAPPDWYYSIPGRDPLTIKAENVIVYTPAPSPALSLSGAGPMSVIFREASIHNAMTDFVKAFFDNGGMPAYGLVPRADANGVVKMTRGQADEIRADWKDRFKGAGGLADIAIMVGIEDVKKLGLNFDEMAYPELRDITELDIAKAFMVPAGMVGIKAGLERNTFTNYGESITDFYQRTIGGLWARLDGAFTRGLLPEFVDTVAEPNISVEFDTSEIKALQEDVAPEREFARTFWNDGLMMLDEARGIVGLPELPGNQGKILKTRVSDFIVPVFDLNAKRQAREKELTVLAIHAMKASLAHRSMYGSEEHQQRFARMEQRATKYERRIADKAKDLFREQERAVLAALRKEGRSLAIIADDPFDKAEWRQTFLDGMEPVFTAIASDIAESELKGLNTGDPFDVYDKNFTRFLEKQTQRFAKEVTDTTWDDLKRSLTAGIEDGENIQSLAARVEAVMGDRIRSSASTIARTEYAALSTGGTHESWRQSGVVIGKRWQSSLTETTRPEHEEAHGQARKLDEDFEVGGDSGDGPGLMGSAENDCNCQCYTEPILEGEEIE